MAVHAAAVLNNRRLTSDPAELFDHVTMAAVSSGILEGKMIARSKFSGSL